jgi:hypothetical protein
MESESRHNFAHDIRLPSPQRVGSCKPRKQICAATRRVHGQTCRRLSRLWARGVCCLRSCLKMRALALLQFRLAKVCRRTTNSSSCLGEAHVSLHLWKRKNRAGHELAELRLFPSERYSKRFLFFQLFGSGWVPNCQLPSSRPWRVRGPPSATSNLRQFRRVARFGVGRQMPSGFSLGISSFTILGMI